MMLNTTEVKYKWSCSATLPICLHDMEIDNVSFFLHLCLEICEQYSYMVLFYSLGINETW